MFLSRFSFRVEYRKGQPGGGLSTPTGSRVATRTGWTSGNATTGTNDGTRGEIDLLPSPFIHFLAEGTRHDEPGRLVPKVHCQSNLGSRSIQI